jgi:hypothetical protein
MPEGAAIVTCHAQLVPLAVPPVIATFASAARYDPDQMKRPLLRPLTVVVAALCVLLGLGLAWIAGMVNHHSNQRLLEQQVRQAATTLSGALPAVQSELLDGVQVGVATSGNPQAFQRFAAAQLARNAFTSISLWKIVPGGSPQQLVLAGGGLALVSSHQDAAFFASLKPSDALQVTGILSGGSQPHLGYAMMPKNDTSGFVVYAEGQLPANRRFSIPASSPYSDLDAALYLGPTTDDSKLLEATGPTPIKGTTATVSLPFGNTEVTLVGASKTQLAGGLSAALPWIAIGVGVLLAIAGGSTVEYVARRRQVAEGLAADNDRLYREQRNIAGTLQHALLPEVPVIDDVEIAARYIAGVAGIEVGGDWYDVIRTGPDRFVFFVGDVSGRGLSAATTMASLRYAIRAYVAQGDSIDTVLTKLGAMLDIEIDQHFATVLAGEIDLAARRLSLAAAGHFLPVLVTPSGAQFAEGETAPPVGIGSTMRQPVVSFDLPKQAMLLAFTDGVVERKGELIDEGLERLRVAAGASNEAEPLEKILDELLSTLVPDGTDDDVVVLGLRWTT